MNWGMDQRSHCGNELGKVWDAPVPGKSLVEECVYVSGRISAPRSGLYIGSGWHSEFCLKSRLPPKFQYVGSLNRN